MAMSQQEKDAINQFVERALKGMNEAVKDIKPVDTSKIKLSDTFAPGEEYTIKKKQ